MQQGHFIESSKRKKNDSKVFRDLSMVGKWKGTKKKKKLRSWGRTKKKKKNTNKFKAILETHLKSELLLKATRRQHLNIRALLKIFNITKSRPSVRLH